MKRSISALAVLAVAGGLIVAFAQGPGPDPSGENPGGPRGPRGPRGGPFERMYDTKMVETITGEVIAVEVAPSPRGPGGGMHLRLNAKKETVDVALGPERYLKDQSLQIKAGDNIEVRGSRVTIEENPVVIAAEVKRGDESLILRDDNGIPKWAGQGREGRGRRGRQAD